MHTSLSEEYHMSQKLRVIVIGAGSTGTAAAHDLQVTVIKRGEIASGTTGRNHCLLHSGGRYAVTDHEGAVECIEENMILRHIMLDALELNDGLFVAVDESDLAFKDTFLANCEECHIPARDIAVKRAGDRALSQSESSRGGASPRWCFRPLSVLPVVFGHGQEERRDRFALP
jgi:glycerol-3-phosphate dehydrogenase